MADQLGRDFTSRISSVPGSRPGRTRSTAWSRPGDGNALTWTLRRWRCCPGSPGSPIASTVIGGGLRAHGLESWEFDVLAALRAGPGEPFRSPPASLARETLVTSGTMTNRVDRLAARGLVEREDHPDDRRGVLVRLTDAGRARESMPPWPTCLPPSTASSPTRPSAKSIRAQAP